MPEEIQQQIKELQYKRVCKEVWNAERKGPKVRVVAMERIESLIQSCMSEEKLKDMSTRDKNELSKMIMKLPYIQESIDKLSGVGNRDGKRNYGDVNVNVTVDVTDRMKELSKKDNKVIDVEYKEIKDKKDKKKDDGDDD